MSKGIWYFMWFRYACFKCLKSQTENTLALIHRTCWLSSNELKTKYKERDKDMKKNLN